MDNIAGPTLLSEQLNDWEEFLTQWDILSREAYFRHTWRQQLLQDVYGLSAGSIGSDLSQAIAPPINARQEKSETDHEQFKQRIRDFCLGKT